MTDQPMDPRDDRLDDVDAPREVRPEGDETVVNLDRVDEEVDGEHQTADDKYIDVVDGRPETLGAEKKSGTPDDVGFADDMWKTEPGSEGRDR
ncbi:MAG TPA: hypothetical protein GXZ45_05770 [Propionibacterium sp.]|nr:hypothetical protein [Propionibacterium sp.]